MSAGVSWGRSNTRQRTRREEYADGSSAVFIALGRSYVRFHRDPRDRKRPELGRRPPRQGGQSGGGAGDSGAYDPGDIYDEIASGPAD